MTSSIILFTFSPIQPFIAEARRAADLYTGSQILVELAKAARDSLVNQGCEIIYPAGDTDDVPNKIVAKVSWGKCEAVANEAKQALLNYWKNEIVKKAHDEFEKKSGLPFDALIWNRQTAEDYLWEIYWSAALLPDENQYKETYKQAEAALNATKLARTFHQFEEEGFKDTLSGKREALHAENQNGSEYWYEVGQVEKITPIKVRPSVKETQRPRERLDALGVVKRFHPKLSEKGIDPFSGFPSTSSIASLDYLKKAEITAKTELKNHADAVFALLGKNGKYYVRNDKELWRFDGDLLYPETFTENRLRRDYGVENVDDALLKKAQSTLSMLISHETSDKEKLGEPSPYYAIIKLDGDSMGKCLRDLDEQGHREFSRKLSELAEQVKEIAKKPEYHACIIYNGGDDVLAMAPLSKAVEFAKAMAGQFKETMKQWEATASAGIVITHHLSPLSNALREVQKAEEKAKEIDHEKNAVCVTVLRRSGETLQMVSKWDQMDKFSQFVKHFEEKELSSKLPYDIAEASYALQKADEMANAEIRRLVKRHSAPKVSDDDEQKRATELFEWAKTLPCEIKELADWLSLIRFVSQGGKA